MLLGEKRDALMQKCRELELEGIFYIWDDQGTGWHTPGADAGDALVAIKRIMETFGLLPEAVMETMR